MVVNLAGRLILESDVVPGGSIQTWLDAEAVRSQLSVERIHPSESLQWFEDRQGNLVHKSGGFFRVVGVEYHDPLAEAPQTQPILDQPEVGTLCFLTARQDHAMWVLACVPSRVTAAIGTKGADEAAEEIQIARVLARQVLGRARRNFCKIDDNEDELVKGLAEAAYERGGYGWDVLEPSRIST